MSQISLLATTATLLACIVFSMGASLPKPREVPGFTYLGSLRSFNGKDFDDNYYYASSSSGDWSRAEEDCIAVFGTGGHIMSLESEEEQVFMNKWLQDRGSGGAIYWTSGQYDMSGTEHVFRWAATGEEVGYTNWAPQQPSLPIAGFSRIALNHLNQFSADWINSQNTALHRYVCEYMSSSSTGSPQPTTPPPATTPDPTNPADCATTNDLVIVLDSSGSVGVENFQLLKQFTASLAAAFTSASESKVGFVVYSEIVRTVIDLSESLTPTEVEERILGVTFEDGPTPTDLAIAEALRMLITNKRNEPRSYLVITDGVSNDPEKTKEQADAAAAEGIRTFSLGITSNVNEAELLAIAGGSPENVFQSEDFTSVDELLLAISSSLCP